MTFDVIVGIPSRNEAKTIANVVRQIDAGLASLSQPSRCLIVNFDNSSEDGTRAEFQSVATSCPKEYRSTRSGIRGKGHNVLGILELAGWHDVRALAILDADSTNISPDWIVKLLRPVLDDKADFVAARYETTQGGHLQNLIAIPFMYGIFAADVEQPVGGEFAFSGQLLRKIARTGLPESAYCYGIDMFLTVEAVMCGARHGAVDLGKKLHRPRAWDTVSPIVHDVIDTTLYEIARHHKNLLHVKQVRNAIHPPYKRDVRLLRRKMTETERTGVSSAFRKGIEEYHDMYRQALPEPLVREMYNDAMRANPLGISAEQWRDALYGLTAYSLRNPQIRSICSRAIMPLFHGRLLSYSALLIEGSDEEISNFLHEDMELFFLNRGMAIGEQDAAVKN